MTVSCIGEYRSAWPKLHSSRFVRSETIMSLNCSVRLCLSFIQAISDCGLYVLRTLHTSSLCMSACSRTFFNSFYITGSLLDPQELLRQGFSGGYQSLRILCELGLMPGWPVFNLWVFAAELTIKSLNCWTVMSLIWFSSSRLELMLTLCSLCSHINSLRSSPIFALIGLPVCLSSFSRNCAGPIQLFGPFWATLMLSLTFATLWPAWSWLCVYFGFVCTFQELLYRLNKVGLIQVSLCLHSSEHLTFCFYRCQTCCFHRRCETIN
jgi:hypothetical protein